MQNKSDFELILDKVKYLSKETGNIITTSIYPTEQIVFRNEGTKDILWFGTLEEIKITTQI